MSRHIQSDAKTSQCREDCRLFHREACNKGETHLRRSDFRAERENALDDGIMIERGGREHKASLHRIGKVIRRRDGSRAVLLPASWAPIGVEENFYHSLVMLHDHAS